MMSILLRIHRIQIALYLDYSVNLLRVANIKLQFLTFYMQNTRAPSETIPISIAHAFALPSRPSMLSNLRAVAYTLKPRFCSDKQV